MEHFGSVFKLDLMEETTQLQEERQLPPLASYGYAYGLHIDGGTGLSCSLVALLENVGGTAAVAHSSSHFDWQASCIFAGLGDRMARV